MLAASHVSTSHPNASIELMAMMPLQERGKGPLCIRGKVGGFQSLPGGLGGPPS
jgi:hypothetical protein